MKVAAKVLGLTQLVANAQKKNAAIRAKTAGALNTVAKEVFSESQRRVPVDTGNLRGSGRISAAKPDALVATLSYGGTASAYALIVHETHKTKSKYLEAPARERAKSLKDAVAVAVGSEA